MTRTLAIHTLVLALASTALAQDKGDEALQALQKGLEASVKQGGLVLKGKMDHEDPFSGLGVEVPGLSGGNLTGEFTGTVAADGVVTIRLEGRNGTYELYKKGTKIVQRQTWTGAQPQAGNFAGEATALANLAVFLKHLSKAKDVKLEDDRKVGETECTVVKGSFPPSVVPDTEEGEGEALLRFKMIELKKVAVTFYMAKGTSLVQRLDVTVEKGLSELIKQQIPGFGEEDEEKDKKKEGDKKKEEDETPLDLQNLNNMKFKSSYRLIVSKYEKDLKIDLPEDVKKHFQD